MVEIFTDFPTKSTQKSWKWQKTHASPPPPGRTKQDVPPVYPSWDQDRMYQSPYCQIGQTPLKNCLKQIKVDIFSMMFVHTLITIRVCG